MANNFLATANRVAAHLGKAPKDFTKEDIIRVVQDFDIRMVNLMYPGGDGRLKTLNFMLNSADYLNTILTCGERVDGRNMMLTPERTLSVEARKAIAGMMDLAQSITAFGNKNPMSWLRLVPHQEAPTNICWGMSNRSVLVRVPLGWTSGRDMCMEANPNEPHVERDYTSKQTVEMRSPDGSADIFQLLAGLCVTDLEKTDR